jgi:hypothetical protein
LIVNKTIASEVSRRFVLTCIKRGAASLRLQRAKELTTRSTVFACTHVSHQALADGNNESRQAF